MPDLFLELVPGNSTDENVQRMVPKKGTDLKYIPTIAFRIEGVAGAENAFAFAVENPTGQDLLILEVLHYLNTKSTVASGVIVAVRFDDAPRERAI